MRLTSHSPKVVGRHGVAVLDAELLQGPDCVTRGLRTVGVVRDGRERGLTVLGGHAPVQLVQHGPGGGVLGLLLAASTSSGGQITEDNL